VKIIIIGGKKAEQDAEPKECSMCKYNTGCDAYGCVSPGCELTKECFSYHLTGTWCPFGEIPEWKRSSVQILKNQ
jgi:hypothetical protein